MNFTGTKIERHKVAGSPIKDFGDDEDSGFRFLSLFIYSEIMPVIKKSLRLNNLVSSRKKSSGKIFNVLARPERRRAGARSNAVEPGSSDFKQKLSLIKILPKELIGETSCR